MTCRNPSERQKYRQTQKLPERFLCVDISFSLFSRHLATTFYSCKYGRYKFFYFYRAFHLHKSGNDVPLANSKWKRNLLFLLEQLLSVSTLQATGMGESKPTKTLVLLYDTKANCRYIKNIPFTVLCMLYKVLGMNRPRMVVIFKWQAKMKKVSDGIHIVLRSRPCSGSSFGLSI